MLREKRTESLGLDCLRIFFAPSLLSVYALLSPLLQPLHPFVLFINISPRLFIFNAISGAATRGVRWQAGEGGKWIQLWTMFPKKMLNKLFGFQQHGKIACRNLVKVATPCERYAPSSPVNSPQPLSVGVRAGLAACPELIRRVKWNVCCCHM